MGDYSKILFSKAEEDKQLYLLADKLGYSGSQISDEIINLVETSICDYQKFSEASKKLNERELNQSIREKLHEAYAPYSESFNASEQEISKNLSSFLDNYYPSLDLRELGQLEEIAQAINLDLTLYKRNWLVHQINSANTLESLNSLHSLLQDYPDLLHELNQRIESFEQTMSINQVVSQILSNRSWSELEADYLNKQTVENYKNWLLERHPDKYFMINKILGMNEKCSSTLNQAIIELAQGNKLNTMRAKKLYDIDIDS